MKQTLTLALVLIGMVAFSCKEDATTTPSAQSNVTVSTNTITLLPNSQIVFRATVKTFVDTTVTWRVEPSSGGTITQAGVNTIIFKAAATTGTVKVIARANADASHEATITVTIAATVPDVTVLFSNENIGGVQNAPTSPTTFTTTKEHTVVYVHNYHYFNGGVLPGTIALKHQDGTVYGPWLTVGTVGQGGVANAYWVCYPYVKIKAGTYTVVDSHPATWSHNAESGHQGFTRVHILQE